MSGEDAGECRIDFVHDDGKVEVLKEKTPLLEGEVIDASVMESKKLREFLRIFNLGFRRIDRRASGWFFYRNRGPAIENDRDADIGLCEVCENFSYNLKHDASNRVVCENCR